MESAHWEKRRRRVMLVFNPLAGSSGNTPAKLLEVLGFLQNWGFIPEVFLIKQGCDLHETIQTALLKGVRMFIACGGDGTVSSVARELIGISATMGIIPAGTQNNIAYSLGIPINLSEAAALLRTGRRIRVDTAVVQCSQDKMAFVEVCSVGLISELFPSSDDIQHGKITKIGDFIAALTSSPSAKITLKLDDGRQLFGEGHMVLISNMPFFGRHYHFENASFRDGKLDVMYFGELSKLDLIGYVIRGGGRQMDPRIAHFRVRNLDIETDPPMSVMADGCSLGKGPLHLEVIKRSLGIISGRGGPIADTEDTDK